MSQLDSFKCPITFEIMTDPVICVGDGHTYEKSAITKWLEKNETSPLTGETLASTQLIPNHSIRKAIEEYSKSASVQVSSVPTAQVVEVDAVIASSSPVPTSSGPPFPEPGMPSSSTSPVPTPVVPEETNALPYNEPGMPSTASYAMRGQQPKPKKKYSFFGKPKKDRTSLSEVPVTEVNAGPLYPPISPQQDERAVIMDDLDPQVILNPPGPRVLMGTEPRTGTHLRQATAGELGMYSIMTNQVPLAKRAHVTVDKAPLAVDTDLSNAVIVSGGKDCTLRVWDRDMNTIAALEGHRDWIQAVAVSSQGDMCVSAGRDQKIFIWSLPMTLAHTIKEPHGMNETIHCCVMDKADARPSFVISGGTDWNLRTWDSHTWEQVGELGGHSYAVRCVDLANDGGFVVSGGDDREVVVHTNQGHHAWKRSCTLSGHTGVIRSVNISPDRTWFVSAGEDGEIRVWDTRMWRCLHRLSHRKGVAPRHFDNGGENPEEEAANQENMWEGEGNLISMLHTISSMTISRDGSWLTSVGESVSRWDTTRWERIGVQEAAPGVIHCCTAID